MVSNVPLRQDFYFNDHCYGFVICEFFSSDYSLSAHIPLEPQSHTHTHMLIVPKCAKEKQRESFNPK